MTAWFLSLFSAYRFMQSEMEHADEVCRTLQERNAGLERENEWLRRQYEAERGERVSVTKRHENVLMQTAYGCKPPHPEEFALEERRRGEPGPIPCNREFGHDAVRSQSDAFVVEIEQYLNKHRNQSA
jgi:hypothetical protein